MACKEHVIVVNNHPEFLAVLTEFLTEEEYGITTISGHRGVLVVEAESPLFLVAGGVAGCAVVGVAGKRVRLALLVEECATLLVTSRVVSSLASGMCVLDATTKVQ